VNKLIKNKLYSVWHTSCCFFAPAALTVHFIVNLAQNQVVLVNWAWLRCRWAWLDNGSLHGGTAAAGTGLGLATDDLEHDELASGELVGQRHDRLLVVADEYTEHIHSGVDRCHRRPVRHPPHTDRVVT